MDMIVSLICSSSPVWCFVNWSTTRCCHGYRLLMLTTMKMSMATCWWSC